MENGETLQRATDTVNEAIAFDTSGEYADALEAYRRALEQFLVALRWERNPATREVVRKRVITYMERAESLDQMIRSGSTRPGPNNKPTAVGASVADETARLRSALSTVVLQTFRPVAWDDVAGLRDAKRILKETVVLPRRFPQLFTGERRPWTGILLYGPPGTGKTHLAHAVATEAKTTFYSVSSSDLVSKWQGESERLVKQLFEMARESPNGAVIFIDEIDSLCSARSDGEDESTRRIKTEFLVQMGALQKDGRVLVLGATNTPWALDTGIRRRFERRIHITLPDVEARETILRSSVGSTPHTLSSHDFTLLAQKTEGYSGADLSILVRTALYEPIGGIEETTHFRIDQDGSFFPVINHVPCESCSLVDPKCKGCGVVRMSLNDVPAEKICAPLVTLTDLERGLQKTSSTVAKSDLARFILWTNEFGNGG